MRVIRYIRRIKFRILKDYILFRNRRKNENAIKWGIVGLGNMGKKFSEVIEASSLSKITNVFSSSTTKIKKFKRRYSKNIKSGNYDDYFSSDNFECDIFYIATPVDTHYKFIKHALLSNKNVLCEKPICLSLEEVNELYELASKRNLILIEGMWTKNLPTYILLKNQLSTNNLGDNLKILINFNKKQVYSQNDGYKKNLLFDFGIYAISFAIGLMEVDEVKIKNFYDFNDNGEVIYWSIELNDSKSIALLQISSLYQGDNQAYITDSEYTIVFKSPFNRTNKIIMYNKKKNSFETINFKYVFEGFEFQRDYANKLVSKMLVYDELLINETKKTIEIIEFLDKSVKK